MKTYGGVEVQLQAFLTLALDRSEWSASHPRGRFPGSHWIGGSGERQSRLDMIAKRKFPAPDANRTPVVQPVAQSLQ
jgi:hypothetical protein